MSFYVYKGWGLTESGGLCSLGGLTGDILNTVGLLIPNYTLKVSWFMSVVPKRILVGNYWFIQLIK